MTVDQKIATLGNDGIYRAADFSPCRTWRYTLRRTWAPLKPRLLMTLLNPSEADETRDDPTNRRGIGFAKLWGFGSLVFCNEFAFRTPSPAEMKRADDPVGPENDAWILREAKAADKIVVAWGVHGDYRGRDAQVLDLLADFELFCFGRTKDGHPKHPLYLRRDTRLRGLTR